MRRRTNRERGLLTTELAVLFPIVIAITLGIVQTALWAHAGAVAQAAADHGVEVAAAYGSNDAAGEAAAEGFVANAGLVSGADAVANNAANSELVVLQVTGTYPSVFGTLQISASATTVRERPPG